MKRIPFLFLAALLGAVVSAPAQQFGGRFGREQRQQRSPVAARHGGHDRLASPNPVRVLRPSHRAPAPAPVRGHWQTRVERVLVPGYWQEQHVPPTYGWVIDRCGRRHWGIVAPGGCTQVWIPARWEDRATRVWVGC